MKVYKLDKIVAVNTDFLMESYRAFVIEALGTNDGAEVTARIDAKVVGRFRSLVAPLRKVTGNLAGPLPLGSLFLVVPPNKTMRFDGTSGSFVRLIGKMLELDVGEALPSEYLSRFANQHNEYLTCFLGSTVSTGTSMADGAEITLASFAPTTIEELTFNNRTYVEQVTAGSPAEAEGNLGVRFYLDGAPLDHLLPATGRRGIARFSMDLPSQALNRELEPFTLNGSPIKVPGDKVLDVRLMNVSGAALFGTTAASFRLACAYVYKKAA